MKSTNCEVLHVTEVRQRPYQLYSFPQGNRPLLISHSCIIVSADDTFHLYKSKHIARGVLSYEVVSKVSGLAALSENCK